MKTWMKLVPLIVGILLLTVAASPVPLQAGDNPYPPKEIVKLVFIHHSTGENWLTDDYGDLGRTLGENNYFVSDTNYGWGPDAIGDRTDIPNWTEWFASDSTPRYMQALFNESGQNSSYTRALDDPGGENEIIMFKSCFPNSALEGNPDDPPGDYEELTVSGAKYVYNTILQYFAAHPNKLFVVVTAPPLSDATYADNARAFNQWLVNDWLSENHYELNNVFVFDFYNVLTSPDAHHRFNETGFIEHTYGSRNTLYYPSEDDHPSVDGSHKATDEFVPLLNVFYHRWKDNAPAPSALIAATEPPAEPPPQISPASGQVIEDFDSQHASAPYGWETFFDEGSSSALTCEIEAGTGRAGNSLHMDFNIGVNGWGTCAAFLEPTQNWSAGDGLAFYFRASQAGLLFDLDLTSGPDEAVEMYIYTIEAPAASVNDWIPVELRWADFHRANWEENAGTPFTASDKVTSVTFGVNTPLDATNTGEIWVDDLRLMGAAPAAEEQPEEAQPDKAEEDQPARKPLLPCAGGIVLPLVLLGFVRVTARRR